MTDALESIKTIDSANEGCVKIVVKNSQHTIILKALNLNYNI